MEVNNSIIGDSHFSGTLKVAVFMQDMRFSQWCGREFKSSSMWHFVTGYVFPSVLKDCGTFIFMAVLFRLLDYWKWRYHSHSKCQKPHPATVSIPEDASPLLFMFVNKVIGQACTKGCLSNKVTVFFLFPHTHSWMHGISVFTFFVIVM